jgi:BTB/POZ domain
MKLECVYSDEEWCFNNKKVIRYTCKITDASITEPGTEISSIFGNHLSNRSNVDVTAIYFEGTIINYFPRKLHKLFSNLKALQIYNCSLKEVSNEDLIGLEILEDFCLTKNDLQSLPSDLFVGMSFLKQASFKDNKLKFLSSALFEPVAGNELQLVSFSNNTNIDAFYSPGYEGSVESIQKLMDIIDEKCKDNEQEEFMNIFTVGLKDLWASKEFSDFKIVSGGSTESKEFAVHKSVLAAHSGKFAAIIREDTNTGKLWIKDFDASTVEGMLCFMYTGETQEKSNAMDLHAIAHKYEVKLLKQRTEKIIMREINEVNVIEIFGFARLHDSTEMKGAAFSAIKRMFPDVKLQESLIEKPEAIKKLVNVRRKLLDAKVEYQKMVKKFKQ